jgi:hypothetical protein
MKPCEIVCKNPVSCGCRLSRMVYVRSSIGYRTYVRACAGVNHPTLPMR